MRSEVGQDGRLRGYELDEAGDLAKIEIHPGSDALDIEHDPVAMSSHEEFKEIRYHFPLFRDLAFPRIEPPRRLPWSKVARHSRAMSK